MNSYIRIPSGASLEWESDPARIAVFTSSCDSSVGDETRKETACESGCTPAPGDYLWALRLEGALVSAAVLEYFEVRCSYSGLFLSSAGASRTVRHARFLENSTRGAYTANTVLNLNNCLFFNTVPGLYGVYQATTTVACYASNCTFDRGNKAIYQSHSAPTCTIDYCLFTNVSDIYAASSGSNCTGCSSKALRYWQTTAPDEPWIPSSGPLRAMLVPDSPYDNADLVAKYYLRQDMPGVLTNVDPGTGAEALGLHWFNTRRDRAPERTSAVDVGFHHWEFDQDLDLLPNAAEGADQGLDYDEGTETDFTDPDTDGDGLVEDDEMSVSQTTQYPGGADPDGDGWVESDELAGGDEDPDFDRDGLWDGWEVELGFDYSWNADTDESLVAWWPMNRPGRDGEYFVWPSQDAGQDPHCTLYVMNVPAPPDTDYLDITSVGVLHRAFRNPSGSHSVGSTTGTRFGAIAQESTLPAWFRMGDQGPPSTGFIAGWGQIDDEKGFCLFAQDGDIYAQIGLSSAGAYTLEGPAIGGDDSWHHAVLRCAVHGNDQVLTLAYDENLCAECIFSESPPETVVAAEWFYVGGESDFEALFPGLQVGDVRVYNCALSDAQLAELGTCPKETDQGFWYTIGPGGGGFIKSLAVSPVNNDWVYAGSDVGGFYRSYDGGMHWQICNAGMRNIFVEAILPAPSGWSPSERVCWAATQEGLYEFDPGTPAPNRVYAGTDGCGVVVGVRRRFRRRDDDKEGGCNGHEDAIAAKQAPAGLGWPGSGSVGAPGRPLRRGDTPGLLVQGMARRLRAG